MSALPCIFCQIARSSTTSTRILYQDDKIVAFQDINPAAFRHYLVIPVEHIATVKTLQKGPEHYSLVSQMLNVGKALLEQDAPHSNEHRFGFHQPPFNSVDICIFIVWHFLLCQAGSLLNIHHWGQLDSLKQRSSWRNLSLPSSLIHSYG